MPVAALLFVYSKKASMNLLHFTPRPVDKPWGRRDLPPPFGPLPADAPPVGEIHFLPPLPIPLPLLVKYLFTSDRLSIQVHPDNAAARQRGLPSGKDEAWYVVAAEPGATIGLGLLRPMDKDELRARSLDGSIVELLDWRPVRAGDVLFAPAGTIHAVGAGVSVIEVQQNLDLTYRLYDYGSERELHLENGIAVANTDVLAPAEPPIPLDEDRLLLIDSPTFRLEKWCGPMTGACNGPVWLVPLSVGVSANDASLPLGGVSLCEQSSIGLEPGATLLVATAIS